MEKPFKIKFDFPISHSNVIIALSAIAELHHSDPYYVIDAFAFTGDSKNKVSLLPPQEVKLLKKGSQRVWVHKDSERESLLSIAMGKAIEVSGNFKEEDFD